MHPRLIPCISDTCVLKLYNKISDLMTRVFQVSSCQIITGSLLTMTPPPTDRRVMGVRVCLEASPSQMGHHRLPIQEASSTTWPPRSRRYNHRTAACRGLVFKPPPVLQT